MKPTVVVIRTNPAGLVVKEVPLKVGEFADLKLDASEYATHDDGTRIITGPCVVRFENRGDAFLVSPLERG